MLGEYVELFGTIYVIVMVGKSTYGVVTLRSRACSKALVIVVEQECVSIVSPNKRAYLITLYGHPADIDEFLIGNTLTEEHHMQVGDYFKIDIPRHDELETIYEAVVINNDWVCARVIFPTHLAEKLKPEGLFKICISSLDLIILGNPVSKPVLRAIYG